jgi:hypothetical protein
MADTFDFGLISYPTLENTTAGIISSKPTDNILYALFFKFLGIAQHATFDFLPISWHAILETARRGGTAEIQQMAIDVQNAFAFKRLSSERYEQRIVHLQAFIRAYRVGA